MAKARKQVEVVERVVKEDQEVIVLTLSKGEAEVVAGFLAHVSSISSEVGSSDAVYHALTGAGVSPNKFKHVGDRLFAIRRVED